MDASAKWLARELDPLSMLMNWTAGPVLGAARDYDSAIDALLHALELDPHFVPGRSTLGLIYAYKGMLDESLAQFERLRPLAGGNPAVDANIKALIGLAYAQLGEVLDVAVERSHRRDDETVTWLYSSMTSTLGRNHSTSYPALIRRRRRRACNQRCSERACNCIISR